MTTIHEAEIQKLRGHIAMQVGRICDDFEDNEDCENFEDCDCGDECGDASIDLVRALILDGCRSVRVGENFFLIYRDSVLDLQVSDEYDVMDVLDNHDFVCSPRPIYAMIWRFASEEFYDRAYQLGLLLQQAGLDPAILLATCSTSADEKAVIERLNQEHGSDFFSMKAEEWEDEDE